MVLKTIKQIEMIEYHKFKNSKNVLLRILCEIC
jgi:hypothetical protein